MLTDGTAFNVVALALPGSCCSTDKAVLGHAWTRASCHLRPSLGYTTCSCQAQDAECEAHEESVHSLLLFCPDGATQPDDSSQACTYKRIVSELWTNAAASIDKML